MTVVYLDRVFLLNSVVDYLLFLCAARLCGFPLHRRRLIFCAVLGGVYLLLYMLTRHGGFWAVFQLTA